MKENIKFEKGNIKKLEGKVSAEQSKMEDAQTALDAAEESIPALEQLIEECIETKAAEDSKLEEIFEETKGITEQLRVELEEKTQELAPLQQERSVYQNSLDTAQMEVKLLVDTATRAAEQLVRAEEELASIDSAQLDKRKELKELASQLDKDKARVKEAEVEVKEMTEKESSLAKKSTELLVSFLIILSSSVVDISCTNFRPNSSCPGHRCNPQPAARAWPTRF